jgi:thiol-disulfide isomerase/thioredoxin
MYDHLFFLLLILIIILLIKFYLESKDTIPNITKKNLLFVNQDNNENVSINKTNHQYQKQFEDQHQNANLYDTHNSEFNKFIEEVQKDTMRKINNAVEQGVIEGFANYNNNSTDDIIYHNDFNVKNIKENSHKYKESHKNKNNNDSIISYLNKGNSVKLMLFYKASCPYCSDFMPTWYKIVNNLSNNVFHEEIECEKDYKKANEYQITSVPTIILLVNNEKKMYMGDRNYADIMQFLKYNGVNLVERSFEEFNSTGYSTPTVPSDTNNGSLCPNVSFNTELDVVKDNYMFQVFNANGQYGYATGGNNNKLMTPFTAAYSTVDSYLSSLPDGANISECANNYADEIRGFGLCDEKQLDNILQYQTNVENGSAFTQFDGTDYSTNKGVVTAIKNACGIV